jgi:hypothetical protein
LILLCSTGLSSCSTVDRNDVAAEVNDQTVTQETLEELAATDGTTPTGDQLREQLTKWIRVTVLESSAGTQSELAPPATSAELDSRYAAAITQLAGDGARELYETGVAGSPVICIAAVTTATLDDANQVLALLNSGMAFEDAARQNSTDTVIAEAGGIVRGGTNGDEECLDPATVNPAVVAALQGTPVGQPIAADLDSFSAVLMLRPFDELLPESQSLVATTVVSQDQLDALVDSANIYVDPRYGRWDPGTGSVVALTS